jgi:hypothetical protein
MSAGAPRRRHADIATHAAAADAPVLAARDAARMPR